MPKKPINEELENRIKELERVEKDLRESEQRYRPLFERNRNPIAIIDRYGRYLEVNGAFLKFVEKTRDELLEMRTFDFAVTEHKNHVEKAHRPIWETGGTIETDYLINGAIKTLELTITPFSYKGVDAAIGVGKDITERKQAEKNLRESEKKYRDLIEGLNDTIYRMTLPDGRYEYFSSSVEEVFGYTSEEFINNPFFIQRIIHPDFAGYFTEKWKELLEGKVQETYEYKIIDSKGNERWILQSNKAIFDDSGRIKAIEGLCRNVTERKQAEEALNDERSFLSAVLDNIEEAIVTCDREGRILRFNEAARRLHGFPEQPIPPDQWADYYDLYRVDGTTPLPTEEIPLFRALKGERVQSAEIVVAPKQGEARTMVCSGQALTGDAGEVVGAVVAMHDITERKQAEESLRESEARYGTFINSSNDLVFLKDEQFRYIVANKALADFLDKTPDAVIGLSDFELMPTLMAENCRASDKKAIDTDSVAVLEEPVGDSVFESVKFPVPLKSGRTGVGGFIRDITERKRTEEERWQLQAQLQKAQKMESIGTLAGGIAHNFNNILMGIQGRVSLMMMDKGFSHGDYEHLKGIEEYVKNAVELTKDLLGFARGGKYEVKSTDLNALIKHECTMFGRTKKEMRVHGKYEKDLWTVEVDPGQMRQALLNLYVNAWQAMPGGGDLYVQTENVTLGEEYVKPFAINPGRYVKVSVTDTGVGMDDATLEKVFDPFFSTKDTGQGSGLGLASVYGIIKNHGGFINVYSEKGTGTTFTIYLPASEKEAVKEGHIPELRDIHYGQGTVLLVDDEDMILDVGRMMLEKLGYRVLVARSGQDALDVYGKQKEEIELVILDMIMPGMGGGEAYDRLKEIHGDVRILLSSGYSINGQAKEILDRGCIGFIQKPFAMEELSRRVKEGFD